MLIKAKCDMANNGIYRELRWFQAWGKPKIVEDYFLPRMIADITGQVNILLCVHHNKMVHDLW